MSSLHQKAPNLFNFFTDTEKRNKFIQLFSGDEGQKNMKAFKVLSGSDKQFESYFKVEEGVLLRLVNKFSQEPDKVFDRMSRLTKVISELSTKYSSGGDSVGGSSAAPSTPYIFDAQRLDKFFQDRGKGAQLAYELGMKFEVGLHSTAIPVPPGASTATSIVASLFGALLGNSETSSVKK
ncbi:hypothetical protein [Candidatus Mycoplasma haematominutum]|uniref:hypothetical protein n=1 Tax=Candidatus Mycoplasma haematominutum TaxID=209446 RepID=UPI0002D26487|nr:hypothetical protein [Candidatus Mycoplasma haematominutum]